MRKSRINILVHTDADYKIICRKNRWKFPSSQMFVASLIESMDHSARKQAVIYERNMLSRERWYFAGVDNVVISNNELQVPLDLTFVKNLQLGLIASAQSDVVWVIGGMSTIRNALLHPNFDSIYVIRSLNNTINTTTTYVHKYPFYLNRPIYNKKIHNHKLDTQDSVLEIFN